MTQYIIPIDQLSNQTFDININDSRCRFEFITRGIFLYMNLLIDEVEKMNGQICLNEVDLIQYTEIGFNGKLYFKDTQGESDPFFYGLGDRWQLIYEDE